MARTRIPTISLCHNCTDVSSDFLSGAIYYRKSTVLFGFRLGLTLTTARVTYGCAYAALFPDGLQLADPFAVIRG